MTVDPYKLLEITKEATSEEVNKAYRKLSLQHHPDRNPGDEEAAKRFNELTQSYEVLSDPDRRKLYDETGEITGKVDPLNGAILECIHITLKEVLEAMIAQRAKAETTNILGSMKLQLEKEIDGGKASLKEAHNTKEMLKKAKQRFKRKDDGPNFLVDMLGRQMASIKKQEKGVKRGIVIRSKALDKLTCFSYTVDKPNPVPGASFATVDISDFIKDFGPFPPSSGLKMKPYEGKK